MKIYLPWQKERTYFISQFLHLIDNFSYLNRWYGGCRLYSSPRSHQKIWGGPAHIHCLVPQMLPGEFWGPSSTKGVFYQNRIKDFSQFARQN